jgi:hypothetical protein
MKDALEAAGWEVVLPLKAHFRGSHNRADGGTFPRPCYVWPWDTAASWIVKVGP